MDESRQKYIKLIFVGVVISLFIHMLITASCVWWWEVYKLNVNWGLHSNRPIPSFFYIFYAPSWFWIDLVISVITFSSFAMLIIFVTLLAKVLGLPRGGFIVATTLYHILLLANWIWYEVFRANIKSENRVNPDVDIFRYVVWGDAMYIVTNIVGFLAILIFVSRIVLPRIEGEEFADYGQV